MHTLYLLSVWLHILAAMAWIGGMFFLVLVIVPFLKRGHDQNAIGRLLHDTGLRFRSVGWIALGIMFVTGVFNLSMRGVTWSVMAEPAFWSTPFGRTLGIKLGLFAGLLAISFVHDFFIGPKATQKWGEEAFAAQTLRLRKHARWMGRLTFLSALVMVLLGVLLVRGGF